MPALSAEEKQQKLTELQASAQQVLGKLLTDTEIANGALIMYVGASDIRLALTSLRDSSATAMDILTYITAVDLAPAVPQAGASHILPPGAQMLEPRPLVELGSPEQRFEVIYELQSTVSKQRLRLKVRLADTGNEEQLPQIDTVSDIYLAANWHERETADLFGISFRNHPDPRRILLPDRWDGYPLRKEYPYDGKRVWKIGATLVDGVMADENLGFVGGADE